MASQVIIMGMIFDSDNVPDFGSIRMTKSRYNGVNDYILKSTDLIKLDSITNATDGSTALCTDTGDLYILHIGEWVKFGGVSEENTENTAQTQSVNLSPLNISREELTGSSGLNEPEISDSLTVEPIAESLTDDTSLDTTEQTDEPEILENDLFTKPDDLTVEPIKGGEELI